MKKKWIEYVREKMQETGMKQSELARKVGVTTSGLGHWLNERRTPSIEEIAKILGVVGMNQVMLNSDGSINAVKQINNEQFEYIGVPKDGLVPAVGEIEVNKEGTLLLKENKNGYIRVESNDPDAYCLCVKGTELEPRIKSGEYILLEPNAEVRNGDDVLVYYKDGNLAIRTLDYYQEDSAEYRLSSINQTERAINASKDSISAIHLISGTLHRTRFISNEKLNQNSEVAVYELD